MRPIGTAFATSELSLVASAWHNVKDAINESWRGDELIKLPLGEWPKNLHFPDIQVCIIRKIRTSSRCGKDSIVGLFEPSSSRGTALLVADFSLKEHEFTIGVALPMSFSVPRVGEKLTCVGYADMSAGKKDEKRSFFGGEF